MHHGQGRERPRTAGERLRWPSAPRGMARRLTPGELEHYRKVQSSPAARKGVAEMPRQIPAAGPLLARLARDVPATLGAKPALLVRG